MLDMSLHGTLIEKCFRVSDIASFALYVVARWSNIQTSYSLLILGCLLKKPRGWLNSLK